MATALVPVGVAGLRSGVKAIAAGGQHTCALTVGGAVKCWGENRLGQVGVRATPNGRTPVPVDVAGLRSGITAVDAGSQHTCALTSQSAVKCWGVNGQGQLGTGSRTLPTSTPVDVAGLTSGVGAIGSGEHHACAVTGGGGVKCWGANRSGELGNGARIDMYAPVDVAGLTSGVVTVEPGYYHTCALTSSGGVKCWGENRYGQLGNGTGGGVLVSLVPVDVTGLTTGVVAISAGRGHTCAITTGGGAKCWGDNTYGQLGNGSRTGSTTPVGVVGLTSGVSAIAAGYGHTCALMRKGGVKCWGWNDSGRLGIGSRAQLSTKPVDVRFSATARRK